MEQSFKVDEWELPESELPALLDEDFMSGVTERFRTMYTDFQAAIQRH